MLLQKLRNLFDKFVAFLGLKDILIKWMSVDVSFTGHPKTSCSLGTNKCEPF